MSKNEKPKVFSGRDWKTGRRLVLAGTVLLAIAGGGVVSAHAGTLKNQDSQFKLGSAFPELPKDTVVHYKDGEPGFHVIMENGEQETITYLYLDATDGGTIPAWCVALGVPLTGDSITAQADATNKLFSKLTDEQKAIVNNIAYLARKEGGMDAYLAGRIAEYYVLDEFGVAEHKVTKLVAIPGTKYQDMDKVKSDAEALVKKAKSMRELPSFNNQTIDLIQGVEKTVTDTKSVLPNFPNVKNNVSGLTESVTESNVKLKAGINVKHGLIKDAVQFSNLAGDIDPSDLPYFIYSTAGDSTGTKSQTVLATKDPSFNQSSLNINVIGLGETTITKTDADTGTSETQGAAFLKGAVFGLFTKSDDKPVKWSDGQKGYPITLTSGTKADDTNVSIKMGDDLKAGVKNLDNSPNKYYLMETEAPEGYSLSTKKYDVTFDSSSKFDDKTSNYIANETATDKVNVFNFMFEKVQDDNGSHPGVNGAEFQLIPQDGTKGKTITATSGTGTDSNGYTVNGLTKFDGEANQKAGNPDKDGIAIGHYKMHESKVPDGLTAINDMDINITSIKDSNGKITAYEEKYTDDVTKQVIDDVKIPVEKMKDNDVLLNVNLGEFTDKPITPVVPTIKTKAHTKDGGQTLKVKDLSKSTPMYDKVMLTNAEKGEKEVAVLHRLVFNKKDLETNRDKAKPLSDKQLSTINFTIDDETVKNQENEVQSKIDTTADAKVPDDQVVKYVWTEKLYDDKGKDEKAKHDDLSDQDETITVEKETPKTPVTPDKPSTPSTPANHLTINLPNTGSKVMGLLSVVGVIVLAALGGIATYLIKKNKKKSAE